MDLILEVSRQKAAELENGKPFREVFKKQPVELKPRNVWAMDRKRANANQPDSEENCLLVFDDLNPELDLRKEEITDEKTGRKRTRIFLHNESLKPGSFQAEETGADHRINILMNTSMYDEPWCFPALKKVFKPHDRVCVLAFSFYDDTKNADDWDRQYSPDRGIWYRPNTDPFFKFGLKPEQVVWVDYFRDDLKTMKEKILNSSVLVLPGGAPDLMTKRIREKKLTNIIKNYQQTIVGFSAGAMIQLEDYHITPDEDYPEYGWYKGFGLLKGFDIEVHYAANSHQKKHIEKAMADSNLPVTAIYEKGGMIVKAGKEKSYFGKVDFFEPEK